MSPLSTAEAVKSARHTAQTAAGAREARPVIEAVRDGFDRIAPTYDDDFTNSLIGRVQRDAVWRQLDGMFPPGARILDLGCGTAADAIHFAREGFQVVAVDVSERMIGETRRKIAAAGLAGRITATVLGVEEVAEWDRQSCLSTQMMGAAGKSSLESNRQDCLFHISFDAAISNFGALNCVERLRPVAAALGRLVRPGGYLALGLISRFCLWETLFYALHGRFSKAARRWSHRGPSSASLAGSAKFAVYYRSAREVIETFQPEFRLWRRSGIGMVVPPSYLEAQARRVPKWLSYAARIDRCIETWPVCRAAADHTLLVFQRERQP